MTDFNELEQDVLKESFNIGAGLAADSLSSMVGEEVEISIPDLQILSKRAAIDLLKESILPNSRLIQQKFQSTSAKSPISGYAYLFFPEANSRALVHTLTGMTPSSEDFSATEKEVLNEVGNIILNACLGSFANILEDEFDCAIPEVSVDDSCSALLSMVRASCGPPEDRRKTGRERRMPAEKQDKVLKLTIYFQTKQRTIAGDVMLFLDLTALPGLREEIGKVVKRYGG